MEDYYIEHHGVGIWLRERDGRWYWQPATDTTIELQGAGFATKAAALDDAKVNLEQPN